jgi:hypothetical protein
MLAIDDPDLLAKLRMPLVADDRDFAMGRMNGGSRSAERRGCSSAATTMPRPLATSSPWSPRLACIASTPKRTSAICSACCPIGRETVSSSSALAIGRRPAPCSTQPSSSASWAPSPSRRPRRSSRLRAERIAVVTHSACHQRAMRRRRGSCSGYGEAVCEVTLRPRATARCLPAAFGPRGGNAALVRQ